MSQQEPKSCYSHFKWNKTSQSQLKEAENNLINYQSQDQQFTTQHITISNNNYINTLIINPQNTIPVVLLHGYGAGLGFFYKNYSFLSKIPGYKIYSLDWLGMGNSSRPAFPISNKNSQDSHVVESTENFFTDSLEEWRINNNLEKFTLIGHSLGGYLSCAYALKYPERVERLVLLSPAGVPKQPTASTPTRSSFLRSFVTRLWENNVTPMSILRSFGPLSSSLLGVYTSRRFKNLDEKEISVLHEYIHHVSAQPGSGEYALNKLLLMGAWARYPLHDRVEGLKMSTTFIYGTHDWMDFRHSLTVVDKMSGVNTRVALVKDSGHHLYLDNPEGFNEALKAEITGTKAAEEDGVIYVYEH